VNECETAGVCSPYATCDNYPGSFNCTCNSGYRGDGFNCYGEFSLYAQGDSDVISFRIYRVGQKTGLFFRLDNFVMVSPRKACSMSKFSKFYREKGKKNSHFNYFKYSLPNLLKSSQQLKLCYI